MQLIDVVRCRVAGKAEHLKLAGARLAELLRAHRAPFEHGVATQVELADEPVGSFGRARKRAGENLRVRYEHPFLAGQGVSREPQKHIKLVRLQLRFERAGFAANVAGVQCVEQQTRFTRS